MVGQLIGEVLGNEEFRKWGAGTLDGGEGRGRLV